MSIWTQNAGRLNKKRDLHNWTMMTYTDLVEEAQAKSTRYSTNYAVAVLKGISQ